MAENKYASYMQIVESLGADISFFGPDYSKIYQVDHRLRLFFYAGSVYSRFLEVFQHHTAPDKLIRIQDSFHVCYYFYKTPTLSSDGKLYFCIGPILHEDISEKKLSDILTLNHIPDSLRAELYRFYNQIPIPANPSVFESTLLAVTQALFGEKLSFTTLPSDYLRVPESGAGADDSRHFTDTIENIYRLENAMMDAIAIGDEASALDYYDLEMKLTFRPRPVNPLHSKISGIIVFNTLCRKAIEKGGVHPIYIDEISRRYSIEINNATSTGALDGIQTRIIHDYCELVKAQAHPGYSELIRGCLLYISQHISEKLTLSKIAEAHFVSRQHLSTRFHTETGQSLTDYIHIQQIEHAKKILADYSLSVSEIASLCGYENASYFARIFHRITKMTPGEYRSQLQREIASPSSD